MDIKHTRLKKIVKQFQQAKVLVIGDIMLDHFIWGQVDRISPEAPVPVVQVKSESMMPGGAANVALNLKSLGAQVSVIGLFGIDQNGDHLTELFNDSHIAIDGLINSKEFTTIKKSRIIAHNQQVVRVDRENPFKMNDELEKKIIRRLRKLIPFYQAIIIEDYGKGLINQNIINEIKELSQKYQIFTALDPKKGHYFDVSGLHLMTPNLSEAVDQSKQFISEQFNLPKDGEQLRKKMNLTQLLITLGEGGMELFTKNAPSYHIPTQAKEVYDVSGAGDTVISTYVTAVVSGAKPYEAAYLANLAAGIVIGKLGTAAIKPQELFDLLV